MTRAEFADEALTYLGYPSIRYQHKNTGKNRNGFDCSGFVYFLLKRNRFRFDTRLRHSNEFFDFLGVTIHPQARGKGDLVFFSRDGITPRHIGIMISRSLYVHSPGLDRGEVRISCLKKTPIESTSEDQIYFSNPIGFKRLAFKKGRYQYIIK